LIESSAGATVGLIVALIGGVLLGGPARTAQDATPHASPIACPGPPPAATPAVAPRPLVTAGFVTIRLTDHGFDPSYFEAAVGQDVEVTLVNAGTRPHTFTIDALDVDVAVAPGETTTITIPLPPLGEYTFVSTAPCDDGFGMTGRMTIFI
jgi:plastocyanin